MVTKILPWGDGFGVFLTEQMLIESGLKVGDEVDVIVTPGEILLKKI